MDSSPGDPAVADEPERCSGTCKQGEAPTHKSQARLVTRLGGLFDGPPGWSSSTVPVIPRLDVTLQGWHMSGLRRAQCPGRFFGTIG